MSTIFPAWCREQRILSNEVLGFLSKFGPVLPYAATHYRRLGQFVVSGSYLFQLFYEIIFSPSHLISCRKFDPAEGHWFAMRTPPGDISAPRGVRGVAVVATPSQIFCFGGTPSRRCHVYDTSTDSWRSICPLPKNRTNAVAVMLRDQNTVVALMGGKIESSMSPGQGKLTSTVLLYDCLLDKFSVAPWKLPVAMSSFIAHVHDDLLFITSMKRKSNCYYDGYVMSFRDLQWSTFTLKSPLL